MFIAPTPTESYTLSLHDALPISADEIHQRRFARSGWTHDRHVFTAVDSDGDTAQRVDLFRAHHVGFPEIDGFNQTHNQDRKSTRLNSSHVEISYAVFCLKKKNRT